ncbi:MAG: signal peptidase I [Chlamydiae bacterium]|nr:signal peptidase I [Chlamydiota bacterium]
MKFSLFSTSYSLKKCKSVLRSTYYSFQKIKHKLSPIEQEQIESLLLRLQEAIQSRHRSEASDLSKEAEKLSERFLKKTGLEKIKDALITITLALCAAILIRQTWFELYEIPTGSMRPTLKEKDRLYVSKTSFGLNIPLTTDHVLFDPELAQRSGIFVFTGENMDIKDVDTKYFYIFPGKKQYIKRLMAKPGDTIYFYGGKIYGVDVSGNDISSSMQISSLEKIEHIPFISFEGKISLASQIYGGIYTPVTFYQMNEPVAKLSCSNYNQIESQLYNPCAAPFPCKPIPKDYYDLWGFKNFGMARILTREDLSLGSEQVNEETPNYNYFLEIRHHPSVLSAKLGRDERGRLRPILGLSQSTIPLSEDHLKKIFNNLYTARFIVKNGFAYRYGSSPHQIGKGSFLPRLSGVPDGIYEFYYGRAYQIGWQGISKELPQSHPLCIFSPERTQLLYNLGIEFDTRFSPQMRFNIMPSRYAYFRDGDLYLMGSAIFNQKDSELISFVEEEKKKQQTQNLQYPYLPFLDNGAPILANGSIDKNFIMKYGLTIPEQHYLALGDNHAMSADSRDFGFVPQDNLRGAPDLIFWPFGPRWGYPNQPMYPFINLPRSVVWVLVAGASFSYYLYYRRRNKLPLLKK